MPIPLQVRVLERRLNSMTTTAAPQTSQPEERKQR